ncbi:nicotinate-nucleotide adenylyltransferase [Ideonella sp. A 288]|uniref:nicotinate-nucleotide adenylyltransferase n=1 Tax=Ideonella sp. A 288 TaxID=1962181 RepID=UPI001F21C885|nr:nicotinate-nucleotide adenylyltransferase [Ideonella sp. A 288]
MTLSTGRRRRIGVLGGSFDPPHLAHLALAHVALDTLQLDELRWLPARAPWQKAGRDMAQANDREAMVAAMIADEPRFVLDPRELHRDGPTYTIDTVRELCADEPDADWFLVIGQDQYGRFDTWRDWRELLSRLTLAVAAREGQRPQAPPAVASMPHRVVMLELPRIDIAASDIRVRRAAGGEIVSLVGEPVARYIDSHALYTGQPRS